MTQLTLVLLIMLATAASHFGSTQELPTVYEYFAGDGIQSGLISGDNREFSLNGKPILIVSGAIHYFRVHPSSWRDSLKKLRATGANAIETYLAWNIHEPQMDSYDFGDGGFEFSEFADIQKFIKMAQEEDLLVLLRPGPYICAEWEYGGYPSYLMRDPNMRLRGTYQGHLDRIQKYFDNLLPLLVPLQFSMGGPIIGIQLENEYAYFDKPDKEYVAWLANVYRTSGFEGTLLYTADGPYQGDRGTIDGVLWTGNFNRDITGNLDKLLEIQPDKPLFVMEFWSGWFDYWEGKHDTGLSLQEFRDNLETIFKYNSSVNFFMFLGGTNFGFTNGGEFGGPYGYQGIVTSYDYDAPLSEAGDYTEKYNVVVELVEQYGYPKLKKPVQPLLLAKEAYDPVTPQRQLSFEKLLQQLPANAKFQSNDPTSMEDLDMNGGGGQSFGYIVHRYNSSTVTSGTLYKAGQVHDFATVIVDGVVQPSSFTGGEKPYWLGGDREISLEIDDSIEGPHHIDLLIENIGRLKIGGEDVMSNQQRGLPGGHIYLDNVEVKGFDVFALEFKSDWVNSLTDFDQVSNVESLQAPLVVQSTFQVSGETRDTFLDLEGWHKGIAFVNGFNLGRYFKVGPQRRLYVPRGVLKTGDNTVTIFEQLEAGTEIKFRATPQLGR